MCDFCFTFFCTFAAEIIIVRGRAVVARRAHNPEVVGSNPAPATKENANNWIVKLLAFFGLNNCRLFADLFLN